MDLEFRYAPHKPSHLRQLKSLPAFIRKKTADSVFRKMKVSLAVVLVATAVGLLFYYNVLQLNL